MSVETRWCDECKNWIDADEKQCPVCVVLHERDEARTEVQLVVSHALACEELWKETLRERDEARAEVAEVREAWGKCLDTRQQYLHERDVALKSVEHLALDLRETQNKLTNAQALIQAIRNQCGKLKGVALLVWIDNILYRDADGCPRYNLPSKEKEEEHNADPRQ